MTRFALLVCLVLLSTPVLAQLPAGPNDFPQWRGPNRDGISNDKGLLKEWPEAGPAVAWQIDDVGAGYSSVAVKDGLLVTMGDLDGVEHIIALRVEDGSRVWAVQPEAVAKRLKERVDQEFARFDRNQDGRIDELEAVSGLGWNFYKHDREGDPSDLAGRVQKLFQALDENGDGALHYGETERQFRDQFQQMDISAKEDAEAIAAQRANKLIAEADADKDGIVTRQESRVNYLGRIFSRADQRDPQTNEQDQKLTGEEVVKYFLIREKGKDGALSLEELAKYYQQKITQGDGTLSRSELRSIYGGYRNNQGDGPRGTPTIDGDRVYAEGGNGDLTCLDLRTGKTLWHLSLIQDLGGNRPGWGYSESPLIVDNLLIVTPGGKQGTVAALDKKTGDVVWRSDQLTEAAHYASAVVATIGGVRQVVQVARENAFGLALDTGKLLWRYDGACNGTANCCSPIVDNDRVFVASAYGTGGGLVKVDNAATAQQATEVYFEKKMAIHHGGIVKIGDHMYTNGSGTLMCVNFLTGEIVWQDRSVGKGSLVAADGMLYVLSERQQLALVEATTDKYREQGRIKLEGHGRPSWAHPVVVGGVLYVRDQHTLTAFQVR